MKKTTKIILYTAGAVGALGLTLYLLNKNKAGTPILPEGDSTDAEDSKPSTSTASSFLNKVMDMQRLLGIAESDVIAAKGNVGTKTKAALSQLGLTTTITSDNIDSVIAQIKAKKAQAQTDAEKQKQLDADKNLINSRVAKAKAIINVLPSKKELTWIDDDANLTTYKKDLLGKLVKKSQKLVKNDQILRVTGWKVRNDGFIEANLGLEGYIIVSPYSVTVF